MPGPPPTAPAYQAPAPAPLPNDPNGLGAAATRLGTAARKNGKVVFVVAGAVLDEGERVEALVVGRLNGNASALVLTDRGLLLVDDRVWRPVVERISIDGQMQVQGWQDDRTASLTLVTEKGQLVVDGITDRPLAVEMAQRIRQRQGG
jgi:hypothetical protein